MFIYICIIYHISCIDFSVHRNCFVQSNRPPVIADDKTSKTDLIYIELAAVSTEVDLLREEFLLLRYTRDQLGIYLCMYIYLYIHVCTYIFVYIYMYTCKYVCKIRYLCDSLGTFTPFMPMFAIFMSFYLCLLEVWFPSINICM
jgi:hypothetical protein